MSNMVVQTNVLALNAHRNIKVIGSMQAKASQKLSSGFRINSAADDAAGLAISEKMRAQIRGLDMASKNAADGQSLVNTAEGGLQEIDNMLQRIRELTVQASTDTNDQSTTTDLQGDRRKMQDEIDSLTAEIDSMAERVEFNKKKVLSGAYSDGETAQSLFGANAASGNSAASAIANAALNLDKAELASLATAVAANVGAISAAMGTDVSAALSVFASAVFDAVSSTSNTDEQVRQKIASAYATFMSTQSSKVSDAVKAGKSGPLDSFLNALKKDTNLAARLDLVSTVYQQTDSKTSVASAISAPIKQLMNAVLAADTTIAASTVTAAFNAVMGSILAEPKYWEDADGSIAKILDAFGKIDSLKPYVDVAKAAMDMMKGIGTSETAAFTAAVAAFAGSAINTTVNTLDLYNGANGVFSAKALVSGADPNKGKAFESAVKALWNNIQDNGSEKIFGPPKAKSSAYITDPGSDPTWPYGSSSSTSAKTASTTAASGDRPNANALYFQVGANAEQGIYLNIRSVKTDVLGIGDGKGKSTIDVMKMSGDQITQRLDDLDKAITFVTTERSKLGAVYNRLEYTQKSLDISSDNLSDAESRIRDTDMAKEMMSFTKANVLNQAGISMLAQANQAPQNILSLLR